MPVFALLGISASALVNVFISALTKWLESGAAAIVNGVGAALDETTSVTFDSAFLNLYQQLRTLGAAFALPLLLVATVQAVVRGDGAGLVRTVLVRAPTALLGAGTAIWLIEEGLAVTDAFSSAMLRNDSGTHFTTNLVTFLTGTNSVLAGFEGVLLALVTAAAALLLWVELLVRSSAVLCAALFIPLALVGVIWPVTGHWIRRLAETICALVLSKVVIVGVLVLGIETLGQATGVSGAVEGVAILLLATLAPVGVLRLLPFIEQGAASSLDGLSRHANRAILRAGGAGIGRAGGRGSDDGLTPQRDPIPMMQATPVDPKHFMRTFHDVLSELDEFDRSRHSGDHP